MSVSTMSVDKLMERERECVENFIRSKYVRLISPFNSSIFYKVAKYKWANFKLEQKTLHCIEPVMRRRIVQSYKEYVEKKHQQLTGKFLINQLINMQNVNVRLCRYAHLHSPKNRQVLVGGNFNRCVWRCIFVYKSANCWPIRLLI